MFTVLSNTRNSNLYLIIALAITVFVILGFAVAPSITAPVPAELPAAGDSVYLDYAQRHPGLRIAFIPATGSSVYLDYAQRHPELTTVSAVPIDTTDYFFRHPELTGR